MYRYPGAFSLLAMYILQCIPMRTNCEDENIIFMSHMILNLFISYLIVEKSLRKRNDDPCK